MPTREQMLAEIEAAKVQGFVPPKPGREQMLAEIEAAKAQGFTPPSDAAERGFRVGTRSMGSPDPTDDRTVGEWLKSTGASIAEPWARLQEGFAEITGADPEAVAAVRRGREILETEAAKQPPGSRAVGNVLGDVATMLYPGSKAYGLTKAAAAARPFLSRVVPITAESATVGGVEALKKPEEGEIRLEQGLDAFRNNLAMGAGQKLIGAAVMPRMFRRTPMAQEEMAALKGAGITPDLPMSMGQPGRGTEGTGGISKFARWMHRRPLAAIPPTQGIIKGQQERALGDWRQMILQKTVPEGTRRPVPPADSLRPMEDSLEAIDNWYSAEYKQLLDPFTFDVMSPNAPMTKAIDRVSQNIPGESVKRDVQQKLGDLLGARTTNGQITGSDVSALKTSLRREAKLSQDGVAKEAYYDLIEAINDGVEEGLTKVSPKIAQDYKRLSGPYRNFITVDDAAGRAQFGEFTPKQLDQAGQRKATGQKTNLRGAPLRKESQRGMAVYDAPSNTVESNAFQLGALGGMTYGAAHNPITAAVMGSTYLTSGIGLLPGGTRWMSSELPHQQALSELLRKPGMEELSRAARIGGGQYLAE